ncbi:MAG: YraN family protein [Candidatus Omnitrophota bacterium]|nr:YraN family protein [Candidatus Omnitrophota bacterium]
MILNKFLLGRKGEGEAVRYLKANGYRILHRNLRARFGEIDVVARDGEALCFVEIKARSSTRFGFPEEAVNFPKRQKLLKLAAWYLQSRRPAGHSSVRFDVLSILNGPDSTPARIRLIKGAFEA